MRSRLIRFLAATLLAALMSGCATNSLLSRAVQSGPTLITMRVIEQASDPAEKATRIRQAVDRIDGYLDESGALTLTSLQIYARAQIDRRRLPPSEVFLWEEAIAAVMADLRKRAVDDVLDIEGRSIVVATLHSIRRGLALEGY